MQGRYILSQGSTSNYKEIADVLQAEFSDFPIRDGVQTKRQPGLDISKVVLPGPPLALHCCLMPASSLIPLQIPIGICRWRRS